MRTEAVKLPLTDRFWAWFEANKRQAIGGAIIIVLAGLATGFFLYQREQREADAGEALSNIVVPEATGLSQRPDAANAYLKLVTDYPRSPAAAHALLLAAAHLFDQDKYAEAQQQFERFVREYRQDPLLSEALLGLAACADAQHRTNDAITAYKNLIERQPNSNVIPQARFALARLYESSGKLPEAKTLLEEVERSNPYGSLGSEAGIRLEELKARHPELFPLPAPMTTNAPGQLPPIR